MKTNKKKSSTSTGKVTSKKKSELKARTIAIRLTTEDRQSLDEVVKDKDTTITDYVTRATKEKIRIDQNEKKKIAVQNQWQLYYDSKVYFKKYIDNSSVIKNNAEVYSGVVGSLLIAGILIHQLSK